MLGRLKNLFKKRGDEEPAAEPAPMVFPPREFHPGYAPGARPAAATPPPRAPQAPPDPLPSSVPVSVDTPPAAGDSIKIALKPVLLKLPDVLKAKVRQPPSGAVYISIPLQKVLAQLPQGSVRISFGELRLAAPAGVFLDLSSHDQTPVELPLPEIVAQLRPEQLPRRTVQKKVEVPEEVGGIFGPKGEPLSAVRMSAAPAKTSAASAPAIAPRHLPASGPAITPKPATPHAPPAAPIKSTVPLPPPPIKPSSPLPVPSALRPQTAPSPLPPPPSAPVIKPLQPSAVGAPKVPAAVPAAPAPAPAPQPHAGAPVQPLVLPLAPLTSGWPDAIKQALAELSDPTVSLPADELEQAMKRGKILFPWKRMRSLINPPPLTTAAQSFDDTQLELPLAVIAPLFMAHKRPAASQKKYAIGEQIPDVFTSRAMAPSAPSAQPPVTAPVAARVTPAAPVAPVAPRIPMPAPAAPVRPAMTAQAPVAPAVSVAPRPPQEIGEVFGQPGRRNWTPNEIVQKTSALKGVAGALVAMQDGLLVADHLPPGLNGETIAAFLPQMFTRVLQYGKELKFGEANNFTITVDNVPLKIFKAGGVFFTVLGRAGESLPEPHLSIIAAQLAPQNK